MVSLGIIWDNLGQFPLEAWAVSGQVAVVDNDTCVRFESRGFGDLSRLVNLFLHWTVGAAAGVGEDRPKAVAELQKQWL